MLSDPEMKEIVESFIIETKEILEKLDIDLVEIEKRPDDMELLNQIFRGFHTIKGTSGFLGLDKMTRVTHKCEDILNKLRKGEAALSSELMDGILSSYDLLKVILDSVEVNANEDIEVEGVVELLADLIQKLEIPSTVQITKPEKTAAKKKSTAKKTPGRKKKTKVESTEEVKIIEASAQVQNIESPGINESVPLEIEHEIQSETENHFQTEEHKDAQNGAAVVPGAKRKGDNNIRVDVERLDDLLNIVSELVLGRNRLQQVNSEVALELEGTKFSHDLAEAAKQIDLMTNELQLVVMKTRMIKIGKVFNRFPRVVRDLAKDAKKEIKIEISGEETELDKTLIEEINDPLVHLIRNSADHGIEMPEQREAADKNRAGTIKLSAEHEGNNILICIEDDGKGIDPDKIKQKAVSKGMITKEKAAELSRQDALNLIFLPGFSTAEVVTNVSGRGVGMDVVKTNVTKLRGIISIESNVGQGTKILIKLPLTLAIIPGMIVRIDKEKVVVPLNSIIEVLRVHADNITTINNHEVIRNRDSVLPLLSIEKLLYDTKEKKESIWQYVVVVGIAEKRFGIKVDELIGQKEVVIKSLGNYLGNVPGIAGSTIMGDGTVVMILDISELLHKIQE
ncbi:MAG: chemotaxis protein CheA [Ignavibacteria bacterium CG2_30_36_16]|nr:MAG: chemotaxis protein CheA [Ignavibacteria bacterium CG2_30_36_16]PJB01494.1 MAG: chemotaxis protein CheA [Ignavibacteria bacterium CG_4_9_14_3_um_filter_36_18]